MNNIFINNIFKYSNKLINSKDEFFEDLINNNSFRIERIISSGQRTPDSIWLEEETNEFVLLIEGASNIRFFEDNSIIDLQKGDWLVIPKNTKHRIEYTENLTYWLTIHYE
jgi:cupin 2 domain-containing protein